jgi:Cdc6-like AAA superfamily ATPase
VKSCYDVDEAAHMGAFHCKVVTQLAGGSIYDYYYRTTVETGGLSMRPLHDLTLHMEILRVAQLLDAARTHLLPRNVLCFKTDSVQVQPARKRKQHLLALGDTTFRQLKRPKTGLVTGVTSIDSDERVYRATLEHKPLRGDYKLPVRTGSEVSVLEERWTDMSVEEAHAHVMGGGSLALYGLPGTGKSTLIKAWVEELRAAQKKVCCVAKTHCAVSVLGNKACTVNHFVYK